MLLKDQLLAIERPRARCSGCDASLDDFDRHPSRLRIKDETPERADFCPECWERMKADAYDSYWQSKRTKRRKEIPKLSRREKAIAVRALFESLWDQRDREDVDVHLYFLSHLLMKWGGLRWRRSVQDDEGRETVVFENPQSGDEIEIRSVSITEGSLDPVKTRVEDFLREYAPENTATL